MYCTPRWITLVQHVHLGLPGHRESLTSTCTCTPNCCRISLVTRRSKYMHSYLRFFSSLTEKCELHVLLLRSTWPQGGEQVHVRSTPPLSKCSEMGRSGNYETISPCQDCLKKCFVLITLHSSMPAPWGEGGGGG
jgi:hypothetical protein